MHGLGRRSAMARRGRHHLERAQARPGHPLGSGPCLRRGSRKSGGHRMRLPVIAVRSRRLAAALLTTRACSPVPQAPSPLFQPSRQSTPLSHLNHPKSGSRAAFRSGLTSALIQAESRDWAGLSRSRQAQRVIRKVAASWWDRGPARRWPLIHRRLAPSSRVFGSIPARSSGAAVALPQPAGPWDQPGRLRRQQRVSRVDV